MGNCCVNLETDVDPACGCSKQRCVQCIAYINMILSLLSICTYGFFLIFYLAHGEEFRNSLLNEKIIFPHSDLVNVQDGIIFFLFFVQIVFAFSLLYLAKYLLHAAENRNYNSLRRWYLVTICLLTLRTLMFIIQVTTSLTPDWFISLLGIFYLIYSVCIVRSYQRDVAMEMLIHDTLLHVHTEKTQLRSTPFFSHS